MIPTASRTIYIVSASIFYYAWAEPQFIGVVLVSTALDWIIGAGIHRTPAQRMRKLLLAAGIASNLALLLYFKYANFFVDNVNSMLATLGWSTVGWVNIALPVGVSFIIFEKITYLVAIYRRTCRPADSLMTYYLYVFLFPKLLAGPIVKYNDIAAQLYARTVTLDDFIYGTKRFIVGLAKKVLIADMVSPLVDVAFSTPASELSVRTAWLGVFAFSLQIYFDFSGYSDMAIGMARMMGFRLLENFNAPYTAVNFTDFWRRWHISLSTWIRDYIYIPLGGGRRSRMRTYCNLSLCFLLCGLWHGANWTYILWGLYHGFFLIMDKLWWLNFQRRLPRILNVVVTFSLIMIGWAIFRAESTTQLMYYVPALLGFTSESTHSVYVSANVTVALLLGAGISFYKLIDWRMPTPTFLNRWVHVPTWQFASCLILLVLSICQLTISSYSPFLYFRF